MPRKQNSNATKWTAERNAFLKENFHKLSNQQLADGLGLKLTVVRNQTRALGLKRYDYANWTPEEIKFLQENYTTMGDIQIMEELMTRRPERPIMRRQAIQKKRRALNLHRTPDQIASIMAQHVVPGGRSYTIERNSGAITLNDSTVATYLAVGKNHKVDNDLKQELLKRPELLNMKRIQIQLKRAIKEVQNAK